MPATFTQVESFPSGVSEDQVKGAADVRIQAGAITSTYEGSAENGWTLTTIWNVIGQQ